ncbi:MAG TPA: sugar phosphate isomerase/epimerase [Planctomycetota bacterium]|nr:sugar phosphate isomerase/epimerase [Planctomycetota bacterium]
MKLGVFTVLFADRSLKNALDYIVASGLEAVEIGVGNYPGNAHCPLDVLVKSKTKARDWKSQITDRGLEISALSCHGNPLHPNKAFARKNHEVFEKAVRLAEMIDVKTVINFSGCPGGSEKDKYPNWVTCPWPPDFSEIVRWQWEKVVIPYWRKASKFAGNHGVRVAFEMHPGFVVYNTETMLRLRRECGNNLGANFDPSHLFWQGMDPIASVRALKGCIYHVHAKDCRVYPTNCDVVGVLDTKPYSDEINRSWIFRTVGYGHGREFWNDFVSTLRMVGYDGVLSIEHEDSLMSTNDGFQKAVAFLKDVLLHEKPGAMWWA